MIKDKTLADDLQAIDTTGFLEVLYGNPRSGVAVSYSLSRPHGDLRSRDFPAVRDGESADTVIIDGDVQTFTLGSAPQRQQNKQQKHKSLFKIF